MGGFCKWGLIIALLVGRFKSNWLCCGWVHYREGGGRGHEEEDGRRRGCIIVIIIR